MFWLSPEIIQDEFFQDNIQKVPRSHVQIRKFKWTANCLILDTTSKKSIAFFCFGFPSDLQVKLGSGIVSVKLFDYYNPLYCSSEILNPPIFYRGVERITTFDCYRIDLPNLPSKFIHTHITDFLICYPPTHFIDYEINEIYRENRGIPVYALMNNLITYYERNGEIPLSDLISNYSSLTNSQNIIEAPIAQSTRSSRVRAQITPRTPQTASRLTSRMESSQVESDLGATFNQLLDQIIGSRAQVNNSLPVEISSEYPTETSIDRTLITIPLNFLDSPSNLPENLVRERVNLPIERLEGPEFTNIEVTEDLDASTDFPQNLPREHHPFLTLPFLTPMYGASLSAEVSENDVSENEVSEDDVSEDDVSEDDVSEDDVSESTLTDYQDMPQSTIYFDNPESSEILDPESSEILDPEEIQDSKDNLEIQESPEESKEIPKLTTPAEYNEITP